MDRTTARTGTRAAAIGLAAALALALSACGDDDAADSAPTTAAATGGDNEATTPTTAAGEAATGEPILIGFINSEGGAFSVPEMRVGSEVAEELVNTQLGGAGGRPLQFERCATDGSPEASIDCANQLVEAGVVAVHLGADLSSDAILPILTDAGIPVVGHVQLGTAGMFDENSYYLGTAALAYGAAALSFYKDRGAESIAWFFPDAPTSRYFTDSVLVPTAQSMGIDYQSIYYDPANPNFAVLAATAVSNNPDVSGALAATDGQCQELIGALRSAGYQGDILAASCGGLHEALGDQAVGVHTDADHWPFAAASSAPADKQADLELYAAAMEAAGQEDFLATNAVISFADTVNLARILGTIDGEVTGASAAAALRGVADLDAFDGPTITCDHSVLPGNSACAASMLFFEVQDDGSVLALTDDFLDVAALAGG